MASYRKFLVAFFGLAALLLNRRYGIDLTGTEDAMANLVVSGLVWLVPNATPEA